MITTDIALEIVASVARLAAESSVLRAELAQARSDAEALRAANRRLQDDLARARAEAEEAGIASSLRDPRGSR